jgi:hypothetical protein
MRQVAITVVCINAFLWGMWEFRQSFTMRYLEDPEFECYEWGREWAHRLTFRRFEP